MSTSETIQRAHWAPLSPHSPTSASSTVPKRSVGPVNLPSSPAPSHSSVDAPSLVEPYIFAGPTPPASVPMSQQQSQTSFTDTSAVTFPPNQSGQSHQIDYSPTKGMFDGQIRQVSGSKRKIEDDEPESPIKRPKTEEQHDKEQSTSTQSQENMSSPPLRVCSKRKAFPFSMLSSYWTGPRR